VNAVDEGKRVREASPPAAAEPEAVQSLYARRVEIYPRSKIGDGLAWFQKWRWAAVWATQIVYYLLPWLTWNDRQAVLFDLAARRFYIFGLVLWPQDIVFLTALLIIAAFALFLFTAVGGRLWCGYACPQTVYTEIFMWVEKVFEGDRNQRMRLDREPMSGPKLARKAAKHAVWIGLALWTGYTFVGYFTPVRELGAEIVALQMGGWSAFWILFYGFATYGNAGWMREQVCKYMCPYARFQSAMFDKDTLIVTYDGGRGEPRGPGSRRRSRSDLGLGDCVDCGLCVQVCPTGIDIRKGLQYECIGCAACIDACNHTMAKVGLAPGLVRYSTTNAMSEGLDPAAMWRRVFRPRVLVYGAFLVAVTVALAAALVLRVPLKVDLIRDRGALASEADDGRVENSYRMQVSNTTESRRAFVVAASGLPGVAVGSETRFEVGPASVASVPLRLLADGQQVGPGSHKVTVEVRAEDDPGVAVRETTTFLGLRR
jgi:cytochrome c oxidase accessory protein FixG